MSERLRYTIYTSLVGALTVAVLLGWLTDGQSAVIAEAIAAVLTLATAIALAVAAGHVTDDSWSTIRRALYAAGAAVLAMLGAFGLIAPETSATSLAVVSEVLQVAGVLLTGVAAARVPDATARRAIEA